MTAYTSTQSGDWNDTATWGGAGYPVSGDTATIANTHTVSIKGSEACGDITVDSGGTLTLDATTTNAILTLDTGATLTNNGTISFTGNTTNYTEITCSVTATVLNYSTVDWDAGGSGSEVRIGTGMVYGMKTNDATGGNGVTIKWAASRLRAELDDVPGSDAVRTFAITPGDKLIVTADTAFTSTGNSTYRGRLFITGFISYENTPTVTLDGGTVSSRGDVYLRSGQMTFYNLTIADHSYSGSEAWVGFYNGDTIRVKNAVTVNASAVLISRSYDSRGTVRWILGTETSAGSFTNDGTVRLYGGTKRRFLIMGASPTYKCVMTGNDWDWDYTAGTIVQLKWLDVQFNMTTGGKGITFRFTGSCTVDALTVTSGDTFDQTSGVITSDGSTIAINGKIEDGALCCFDNANVTPINLMGLFDYTDTCDDSGKLASDWTVEIGSVSVSNGKYAFTAGSRLKWDVETSLRNFEISLECDRAQTERMIIYLRYQDSTEYDYVDFNTDGNVYWYTRVNNAANQLFYRAYTLPSGGKYTIRCMENSIGVYLDDELIASSNDYSTIHTGSLKIYLASAGNVDNIHIRQLNNTGPKTFVTEPTQDTNIYEYPTSTREKPRDNKYYIFYSKDTDSDTYRELHYRTMDGTTIGSEVTVRDVANYSVFRCRPIVYDEDTLWCVWCEIGDDNRMVFGKLDLVSNTFSDVQVLASGDDFVDGVAIGKHNGTYVVVYNDHLNTKTYFRTTTDGVSFSEPTEIVSWFGRPSLITYNGKLRLYIGRSDTEEIYVSEWNGTSFPTPTKIHDVLGVAGSNDIDVDTCVDDEGILYVIWGGCESSPYRGFYMIYTEDGDTYSDEITIAEDRDRVQGVNYLIYQGDITDEPSIYYNHDLRRLVLLFKGGYDLIGPSNFNQTRLLSKDHNGVAGTWKYVGKVSTDEYPSGYTASDWTSTTNLLIDVASAYDDTFDTVLSLNETATCNDITGSNSSTCKLYLDSGDLTLKGTMDTVGCDWDDGTYSTGGATIQNCDNYGSSVIRAYGAINGGGNTGLWEFYVSGANIGSRRVIY